MSWTQIALKLLKVYIHMFNKRVFPALSKSVCSDPLFCETKPSTHKLKVVFSVWVTKAVTHTVFTMVHCKNKMFLYPVYGYFRDKICRYWNWDNHKQVKCFYCVMYTIYNITSRWMLSIFGSEPTRGTCRVILKLCM